MKVAFIYIFLVVSVQLRGQEPISSGNNAVKDDPFIRWIANLPSGEEKNNTGFFEKVFNLITGSEPVTLNSPVYVCAVDLNNYIVANQGSGNIIQSKTGEMEVLPVFKKETSYFPSLVSICNYKGATFLLTDSRLNKIFLMPTDGKSIKSFADNLSFDRPTGIAYSEIKDEIWVTETGLHRISVLNSKGELKRIVGKRGTGNLEFNFPTYIWIDSEGKIYIVDSMNFRVQVLSSEGEFISSFGKQGDATGSFARPRGISTDSKGNIYVVDALFNSVQIFDISGNLLYYFGAQGTGKYQFWMPSGIFIDKNDYIYISDSYNGRVQIFQLVKK